MNREQAKIRCKLSKEEWGALGEDGFAKWYEVMKHFAGGGDVEYYRSGQGSFWELTDSPRFSDSILYRIKTKTHIVNGFEVPTPIKEYTGQMSVCVPSFCSSSWVARVYSTECKELSIKRGVAFETEESARANTMAMLGIDPSTYKE